MIVTTKSKAFSQILKAWVIFSTLSTLDCCLQSQCDELNTDTCAQLSKDLEKALLQDKGNLFRMRRAFFYSPTAAPVLLKVIYNVSFGENATSESHISSGSNMDITKPCKGNATTKLRPMNISYGWTSSGVYTVFHPTVLHKMQAQIPFTALRIIHRTLDQRSPEADFSSGMAPMNYQPFTSTCTSLHCHVSQINTCLKQYSWTSIH